MIKMNITKFQDGKVVYCGPGAWSGNCKAGTLSKSAQQEILDKLYTFEQNVIQDVQEDMLVE